MRKEIEGVDKAIMEVIRTLRMAKETLEASLENHDEKMAASTDARLGNDITCRSTQRDLRGRMPNICRVALPQRFNSINYKVIIFFPFHDFQNPCSRDSSERDCGVCKQTRELYVGTT